MVNHYWEGVHKGVSLCHSEKKALETEQRKTSVASDAARGAAMAGIDEGGVFPEGWTNGWLNDERVRRLETGRRGRERDKHDSRGM